MNEREDEMMILMACRHAIVSKLQGGNSNFVHMREDGEWERISYEKVRDYLDEQIEKMEATVNEV